MKYEFKFYLPTTSVNSKHSSSIIVWQIRVPCWVEKKEVNKLSLSIQKILFDRFYQRTPVD